MPWKKSYGICCISTLSANIITKEDDNISQIELAEPAGVTDLTIRNICRSLRRYADMTN
jgi:hypothetical protein